MHGVHVRVHAFRKFRPLYKATEGFAAPSTPFLSRFLKMLNKMETNSSENCRDIRTFANLLYQRFLIVKHRLKAEQNSNLLLAITSSHSWFRASLGPTTTFFFLPRPLMYGSV
jgi:hypothetical protein